MIFFALPQLGHPTRLRSRSHGSPVMIWGGAPSTARTSAPASRPSRALRGGRLALGFGSLGTFLNVTLPIGGRIALPSSINTYISVVKNTSLMYVIGYPSSRRRRSTSPTSRSRRSRR
jgi:hypothetical protein